MTSDPNRKLNLSDPGHDAAGDELELILEEGEADQASASDDAGSDSFLERFPVAPRQPRKSGTDPA